MSIVAFALLLKADATLKCSGCNLPLCLREGLLIFNSGARPLLPIPDASCGVYEETEFNLNCRSFQNIITLQSS